MAIDQPTRIGIGAAAGIALMSIAEPHFYESYPVWTVLIYGTLIGLMVWGFGITHLAVRLARWLGRNAKKMWPQYVMAFGFSIFFFGLIAFLQMNAAPQKEEAKPSPAASNDRPPTMLEYFAHDQESFPTASKQSTDTTLTFADGRTLVIKSDLFRDMLARTTFMAFYIPNSPFAFDAILGMAEGHKKIMHDMMSTLIIDGGFSQGSPMVTQDELTFTGRIFIYHEGHLTLQQRAEADTLYKSTHLGVQFRGTEDLMNKWIADQQSKKR